MRYAFIGALLALFWIATPALAVDNATAHITRNSGKKVTLTLEIANTPSTRERGLMFRKTLKPADGMVFLFPTPTPQKFWMKNTLIPLDMLFVDERGNIVYIGHGKPLSLKPVGPDVPVASVIEIAGGRAATLAIAVGDKVHYDFNAASNTLAR